MRVIANQGDTLDSLCWRHLGSSTPVEAVAEANPGLAALGPVLPVGTPVILPDAQPAARRRQKQLIQLWD